MRSDTKGAIIIQTNSIWFGKYEILHPLGSGSFGTVYLAKHKSLEVLRAIKQIPKHNSLSTSSFLEANILTSLEHSGIPKIYDVEEDESFIYLVEEYLPGEDLDSFLLHQKSISPNLFFRIIEQLCDIFDYLHSLTPAPVYYGDLKPAHIILCGFQIKLIDFGVSNFLFDSGKNFKCFGNLDFSAPEVLESSKYSLSADIFSIGQLMKYLSEYVSEPLSQNVYQIIQQATNTDPKLRFETAKDLWSNLKQEFKNDSQMHLSFNIAILGANQGCGSTYIAMALTSALNEMGYSALYHEKNKTNHLRKAAEFVPSMVEKEYCFFYKYFHGVPLYGPGVCIPIPNEDINIFDYGSLYNSHDLISADIILFVCGNAPWNLEATYAKSESLNQHKERLFIVCNMCEKHFISKIAKLFSTPVFSFSYDKELFVVTEEKRQLANWLLQKKGRVLPFLKRKRGIIHRKSYLLRD